jgi:hypothetical protein
MKMTQEADVLKQESADLLPLLAEMQQGLRDAAAQGRAVHEVELAVWRQVLHLGRQLLGQFFALAGTGDVGASVTLPEGQSCQRLEETHSRRYVSIFGEFVLRCTVYGSRAKQKIEFVPLANRLQLPEGVFSYVLQDWDQSLCVEEAFGQAERTVRRILGLKQSVDSLEHQNVDMARQVADFRVDRPRPAAADEGVLFVSSADGKGIVMRRDPETPRPPAHRTKGDKASGKEMAIVGAVYSVGRYQRTPAEVVAALFDARRPERDRPQPCGKQVQASLAFADADGTHSGMEAVYPWILEELWSRNRGLVKEMVHLCDGQEALWQARRQHLPQRNTTDILDLLHVTPRLWQAAHLFEAEKSAAATAFVRERVLKVLQGKVELVIRGLREMGTKRGLSGAKKAKLRQLCAYLENNRERMRYDEYLAKGYPIASGVIEGACRHLVKDRMERAGMHWTRPGAQAMLDVRSIHVNGDWEAYQSYRIDRENERLYPYRQLVEGENYPIAA